MAINQSTWRAYLHALRGEYIKRARLDFLQPDGTIAFSIDNNPRNRRSGAFIQEGDLSVNLQNGQRRQASITLSNLDDAYDYNVNNVWFGSQIRLMEGLMLLDGTDLLFPQGVFYVRDPEETFMPGQKLARYTLVDKWAMLDGTLFGNLEGWALIERGENILTGISGLLEKDKGNGTPVDNVPPIFTTYYDSKTVTLPDGTSQPWVNSPYTARFDSNGVTLADILLELNKMLVGWIGYDPNGQLRVDAAYEDILDSDKPVLWNFSPDNFDFLGATYSVKNTEVFNDIIVLGQAISGNHIPSGRAVNQDPASDTNVGILGLRTKIFDETSYYADDQCQELAEYYLKQNSVLKKSVTIQCAQLFHITENNLVTIQRTDKPGSPVERHLITGFSRPIAQAGARERNCTGVNDCAAAARQPLPATQIYATIAVTVKPGAVVKCTLGENMLSAVSTGVATFTVPTYGEWQITAETPTESGDTSVDVDNPGLYTVEITLIANE